MQPGMAHDPGLSLLELRLFSNHMDATVTFAQADLESVIALDQNADTVISQVELDYVRQDLVEFLNKGITLLVNEQQINASQIEFVSAASNTIKASLRFNTESDQVMRLNIPLISRFARGHRQHLTVIDAANQPVVQQILSKDAAEVTINADIARTSNIFQQYLIQGVWHIWIGFDHILFLVTLLLPAVLIYRNTQWQHATQLLPVMTDTLKIVTMFTLAHSITLTFAVLKVIQISSTIIEPVIAFSVLITSLNNLKPIVHQTRWLLAFGFGLIHGFGFAAVLTELGLNNQALFSSLLGFNLGVEAGQLAIVCSFLPVAYFFRQSSMYQQLVFKGGSIAAAAIACVWMLERIAGIELVNLTSQYPG